MRRLISALLLGKLRLTDREIQHQHGNRHQRGDHDEKRLVIHMRKPCGLFVGVHHRRDGEIEDAAHRAHEIDDGVGLGAQRLGRHIGHERHRGRTVGAHHHQQQSQRHHEQHQLHRAVFPGKAVVNDRQDVHQHHRPNRTEQDKRHAAADARACPVGQCAEKRQQKQCEHIVRRHDHAGDRLVHMERVGKNERDDIVVHLPERADGKERKSDEDRALVVELHLFLSLRS